MSLEPLKPCPFCGKPGKCLQQFTDGPPQPPYGSQTDEHWGWRVGCRNCEVYFWNEGDEAPAIEAWNRRAP